MSKVTNATSRRDKCGIGVSRDSCCVPHKAIHTIHKIRHVIISGDEKIMQIFNRNGQLWTVRKCESTRSFECGLRNWGANHVEPCPTRSNQLRVRVQPGPTKSK